MRTLRAIAVPSACVLITACAPTRSNLPPVELEAIQTRSIDAPADAVFRAAAGVMLDRGMVITMSDYPGGLVSGMIWIGVPHASPHAITPGHTFSEVVVWVRPDGRGRTLMRVQPVSSAVPVPDAEVVSRIAARVAERTLIAAAPPRRSP